MECMVCGKQFINVGVHARHKHGITAADYRAEFGLLKTAPLVDADLSRHISESKRQHYRRDPEAKAEAAEQCRRNSASMDRSTLDMSAAGREKLARRNTVRNQAYLATKADEIGALVRQNMPLTDIQARTNVAPLTIKAMIRAGMVPAYDKAAVASTIRKRAQATTHRTRAARIDQVLALYDADLSTAEILRRTDIGASTYKRWVKEGAIPKRATYMRPDEKKPAV